MSIFKHDLDILDGLNPEQKKAVTHNAGPQLIIAGAGTGKTTVITRHIAYLIEQEKATADEILALTFTEKAAGEMEERVGALLPMGYFDFWISTFHAFGERILRDHALDAGLSNESLLLTDTQQWLLVRDNLDSFELDYYKPKGNPTKFVQALISHFSRLKDEDITPAQYLEYAEKLQLDSDSTHKKSKKGMDDEQKKAAAEAQRIMEVAKAYKRYQDLLYENNAMDFGDLIVETIHLFNERPALLELYRNKFKYILVDEFQDTNFAQYDLIKMLAAPKNNLTVVADDDQSIYHFRGASMSNILIFQKDFPKAKKVSLLTNYRSRQEILDVAYDFIQHNNPNRLEQTMKIKKKLESNVKGTGVVEHLHSTSLEGEAVLVKDKILELKNAYPELSWSDFAILVRANDHADTFIPYLERANIPYQFLASRGLFAKPVVLDTIAFLRIIDDVHDANTMYRLLSSPVWKMPQKDIATITKKAKKRTRSLYDICGSIRAVKELDDKTYESVEKLMALISSSSHEASYKTVGEISLSMLRDSGYLQYMAELEEPLATEQVLYINQFFKYIEAFERSHTEKTVHLFVNELVAMIESGEEGRLKPDMDDGPESVKLMTVHSAKGLEFEYVFIANLVDKRFPTTQRKEPILIPDELVKDMVPEGDWHLEEERRLFYVGMTRAKSGLYLTSGEDYGGARRKKLSRFLVEAGFADTKPEPTGDVIFEKDKRPTKKSKNNVMHCPKKYSFSQLKAFETCPWQYRFGFVLHLPTPGKPSFSFGKSMHSTLYEFFRRMKESSEIQQTGLFEDNDTIQAPSIPSLEDLIEIYDEKWIDEWYLSNDNRYDYYKKGKDALTQFYGLHVEDWPEVTHLEQGFTVEIGKYTVKGVIDRVDNVDGGVEIIDYKTGPFPKSGKRDLEQLYVYAAALKDVFELEPVKLTYYYIEENKTISEEFDEKKLSKVEDWIDKNAKLILKGDFKPNPGFNCKYCDYSDICEYRSS
ncbi:MAG: ATP-dependent DNA helicase [Candidatus Kerfeldbacteria bacterium]